MDASLINPYIRLTMESYLDERMHIRPRVIYDYELIYVESGAFALEYGEGRYECKEGDLVLLCPGVRHSFTIAKGGVSQPHIHFDLIWRPDGAEIPISFKDRSEMTPEEHSWIQKNFLLGHLSSPILTVKERDAVLPLFYRIVRSHTQKSPLLVKGMLVELLGVILADNCPTLFDGQGGPSIVRQIRDYVDAGYGFFMNLDDFGRRFAYSKFHLEKRFREEYGSGLIEYRNEKRMQYALKLLESTSVTETAETLGFGSIYSFSRAFKSRYGYAPSKIKIKG